MGDVVAVHDVLSWMLEHRVEVWQAKVCLRSTSTVDPVGASSLKSERFPSIHQTWRSLWIVEVGQSNYPMNRGDGWS